MNKEQKIEVVAEFLNWVENFTYYEFGQDVQSDYGDGESYFHQKSFLDLIEDYKEALK